MTCLAMFVALLVVFCMDLSCFIVAYPRPKIRPRYEHVK